MKWCVWTKLPSGKLWCKNCDPKQEKLQVTETRRNCSVEPFELPLAIQKTIKETRERALTPTNSRGPGTELKRLLSAFGVRSEVGCKCNARAQRMDENGCDWCEKNLELIVDWLQEEAERRKLPFFRVVGRRLVKRAIRNARRASV